MSGENNNAPFDLSSMITALMSNPAALGAISSLISGMNNSGNAPAPQKQAPPVEESSYASTLPALPPQAPYGDHLGDNSRRLLAALRPFLSPERCATLDYILKISELLYALRREGGGR